MPYRTCEFCNGTKKVEKWEIALVYKPAKVLDVIISEIHYEECTKEVAASITAGLFPGIVPQWNACNCPICGGSGRFETEVFSAEIFAD